MTQLQYTLFIGDLKEDVVEADIYAFFQKIFGTQNISNVKIVRDHNPPHASLKYGYINFIRSEDADKAFETSNFQLIKGKPCRLMKYQKDPALRKSGIGNICVNGMPLDFTSKQLLDMFSEIGSIISCRISEHHGKLNTAHGFVQYQTNALAEEAIKKFNNTKIGENTITVAAARPFVETVHKTVYVIGYPNEATEEQLNEELSKYGKITRTVVHEPKEPLNKKFSFTWYEEQEHAKKCVDELNGKELLGASPIKVALAWTKYERLRYRKQLREQTRFRNLYCRGFPLNYGDNELKLLFVKYGKVTSCRIMKNENGVSKGFGFCCFSTDEEARTAYLEVNGQKLSDALTIAREHHQRESAAAASSSSSAAAETDDVGAIIDALSDGENAAVELYVNYAQTREERRASFMQKQTIKMQRLPQMAGYAYNPYMAAAMQNLRMGMPAGNLPFMRTPFMNMPNQQMNPNDNQNFAGMRTNMMRGRGGYQQQMGFQPQISSGQNIYYGRRPPINPQQQLLAQQLAMSGYRYPMQMQMMNMGVATAAGGDVPIPGSSSPGQTPGTPTSTSAGSQTSDTSAGATSAGAISTGQADEQQIMNMTEDERKQYFGETLYPRVQQLSGQTTAGKITGMLLELDVQELMRLIEDQHELTTKVNEARQVLAEAEQRGMGLQ